MIDEHGAGLGVDVEVATKDRQVKGFSVIKRRWVVEHTIGWLMQIAAWPATTNPCQKPPPP